MQAKTSGVLISWQALRSAPRRTGGAEKRTGLRRVHIPTCGGDGRYRWRRNELLSGITRIRTQRTTLRRNRLKSNAKEYMLEGSHTGRDSLSTHRHSVLARKVGAG